jgi:hypothetical protein
MEKLAIVLQLVEGLGFISVLAYAALRVKRALKSDPAAELKSQQELEELLDGALFGIVTDLERVYGSGTGKLKLAAALERLLALVPDTWKSKLNLDFLRGLVEKALAAAKQKWADNPGLLGTIETFAAGFDTTANE